MRFLSSPNVSLGCAVINAVFTLSALHAGSIGWAFLSGFFAVFCYYNYLQAR